MSSRGVGAAAVGLDLLFMSVNFSALTLFSTLSNYFRTSLSMTSNELLWAAAVYSVGIFAAFFIGHSEFFESHPRTTVLLAAVLAAIPQFLIPVVRSPYAVVGLRFLQGLVMMAVPIFSAQVGKLYAHARPLALGIILSGIFIGGFIGANLGGSLAVAYGWRATYVIFGISMIVAALIWIGLTPGATLPSSGGTKHAVVKTESKARGVWRRKFTIVWGFTLFPSIWIIFTLAPLISFIVRPFGRSVATLSSEVLEASYVLWSIVIGAIAYAVSRRGGSNPRQLFRAFALVQVACFIVTLIGALSEYVATVFSNAWLILSSLFIIAVIQGTGPTFWSIPSTAYPREEATRAGYALGLISNSAAMIGPLTSLMIASAPADMWLLVSALAVAGFVLTTISLKLRLPVEEVSNHT